MTNRKSNKKYRILVVVRWPVGGIRTFIRYVYRNFDKEKYSLTILAPDGPELRILLNDLREFEVSYVPVSHVPSLFEFFRIVVLSILKGKFDLVHSHGLKSGVCSAIPSFIMRIPHLLTVHDVFTQKQLEGINGKIRMLAISIILPLIDAIHSVSYDAQNNLIESAPILKLFKYKLYAIPNGIETSRFMGNDKRDFRKELNLDEEVFLIGFLGRFMSQKGFCYLIEALHLLKTEYPLKKRPLVLTFGDGSFIREDAKMVEEFGLRKDVHFMPFTENIASALKGLDVVAMPSLWEACGLLAMEAMVSGVPIIGTSCIGLREVMKDTPGILVPVKDSRALADVLYKEMINSSRDKFIKFQEEAASRFDVLKQSKCLNELMNNLIS